MSKSFLVLIPGTLCDKRVFTRQVRALRHLVHIQCIDYRHFNWQGDWAARLLARLPAQFALAGFSLGGLLALQLLRQAPERVERLALIASNAEPADAAARRRATQQQCLLRRSGAQAVVGNSIPDYFHHVACLKQHARLLFNMARQTPRRAAQGQFAWAASRPAGYDQLANFRGPVLVVSGASDGVCPAALQQRLVTAQPSASWCNIKRCGHFVPLEASAHLNRAMQRWLSVPNTHAGIAADLPASAT